MFQPKLKRWQGLVHKPGWLYGGKLAYKGKQRDVGGTRGDPAQIGFVLQSFFQWHQQNGYGLR